MGTRLLLFNIFIIYDYERICKWSHYLAKQKSRSNKKNYGQIFPRKNMTDKLLLRTKCNYIFAMNKLCFLYIKVQFSLRHYKHEIEISSRENAVASK